MKDNLSFMDVTDAPEDLVAYSYAGDAVDEPVLVAFPASVEDIRRTLLYCNRVNIPVVPRGLGTNVTGATVGKKGVVLDMGRFNRMYRLDHIKKEVVVEPGIILSSLNAYLKKEGYSFPIQPYTSAFHTIGGMIALNSLSPRSLRLGRMEKWVRQVDILDGTGKHYEMKEGFDRVVGREGTTGVIVKAHLALAPLPKATTATIHSSRNLPDMLASVAKLRTDQTVVAIDYLNRAASVYTGLDDDHHLIVEYASNEGEHAGEKAGRALSRRDEVHDSLRFKEYNILYDVCAPPEKLFDILTFADEKDIAAYGPIGLSTVILMFKKGDPNLEEFKNRAASRAFTVGSLFGYGATRKEFVPYDVKNAIIKLKDEYDYNNIMNRGKVVDFR